MKTEDGKTTRIGKEQSTDNRAETGDQTEKSEKAGCGEIIVGIEKIGDLIGRSISTVQTYVHVYGMPAEKKEAVWQIDLEKFKSWAAALGWTRQMPESELRVQVRKKDLTEAGPGKVIEARSLDALAKRLYTDSGRLSDYRKQIDCPIVKNDDNTFSVDLNKWELFQIKYRVGEYFLTGNTKGKVSWTC